jgi:uncharacterized membrane protein
MVILYYGLFILLLVFWLLSFFFIFYDYFGKDSFFGPAKNIVSMLFWTTIWPVVLLALIITICITMLFYLIHKISNWVCDINDDE